jgi:hypothetical protein
MNEDIDADDDDAKAIKAAKGARGKFKKLDLAVKALKNIGYERVSHIDGGFGAISQSKFKIV